MLQLCLEMCTTKKFITTKNLTKTCASAAKNATSNVAIQFLQQCGNCGAIVLFLIRQIMSSWSVSTDAQIPPNPCHASSVNQGYQPRTHARGWPSSAQIPHYMKNAFFVSVCFFSTGVKKRRCNMADDCTLCFLAARSILDTRLSVQDLSI